MESSRYGRSPVVLLTAVVVATGLTACGSGSGSQASNPTTATAASTAASAPASTPATEPGTASDTAAGDEPCGVHEIDGTTVRTFCGDQSVTVTSKAGSTSFQTAECLKDAVSLVVNAGTIVLGNDATAKGIKARTSYFGMVIGKTMAGGDPVPKDGTWPVQALALEDHGRTLTAQGTPKVVLTDNRTAGTVTGTSLTGEEFTASFTCAV